MQVSDHFANRLPSAIRSAQIEFAKRKDGVQALNVAIGNVSLPMYPAMVERMKALGRPGSHFSEGVVSYTPTVGLDETREAFVKVIGASGFETSDLLVQITDGGSQAMELVALGLAGEIEGKKRPMLLIDAAYTNYQAMANRVGVRTVSVQRSLGEDGKFSLPSLDEIEAVIKKEKPSVMVVIPYDNPTGQFYKQADLDRLGELVVKHDMWLVSDEAYRELCYSGEKVSSVWGIDEKKVPGIGGRRVSIETVSKVWNACGLRVGALVTDSTELHQKSVAENTASLCTNALGQYVFGAIAHESAKNLKKWFGQQKQYYQPMMEKFEKKMKQLGADIIVSKPEAAIYSVVDVRQLVDKKFEADEFVSWCAREGWVDVKGKKMTLLAAPMRGFYGVASGEENPGRTQMRIAFVLSPQKMELVPELLVRLLDKYLGK